MYMSTQRSTIEYILETLGDEKTFSARAMFGEYALYAKGRVVALVCDDLLYAKITDASKDLEAKCEKDAPYPGAKPHYVVTEEQLTGIADLDLILIDIAKGLPEKKVKKEKGK